MTEQTVYTDLGAAVAAHPESRLYRVKVGGQTKIVAAKSPQAAAHEICAVETIKQSERYRALAAYVKQQNGHGAADTKGK